MARLWLSGFGLNGASKEFALTNGVVVLTTTQGHGDGYALNFTAGVSGTRQGIAGTVGAAAGNGPYFARTYLYITTYPAAENRFLALVASQSFTAAAAGYFTLDNTGAVRLYSDAGVVGSPTAALNLNQWYRLEMRYDKSLAGGSQILAGVLDGSTFAVSTTLTFTNQVQCILLGGNLNAETQTQGNWLLDDAAVNDATGASQTNYPGAGFISYYRPTAVGDNTAWTKAGSAPAATDWQSVNEAPIDDSVTTLTSNTLNQTDDMAISATPPVGTNDTIALVAVGVRFSGVGASANASFQTRLKAIAGGTVTTGAAIAPPNTVYRTNAVSSNVYNIISYTTPGTATAWTAANVAASQVGIICQATSTNAAIVTGLWLAVEVSPGVQATMTAPTPGYLRAAPTKRTAKLQVSRRLQLKAPADRSNATIWNAVAPANFLATFAESGPHLDQVAGGVGTSLQANPVSDGVRYVYGVSYNVGKCWRYDTWYNGSFNAYPGGWTLSTAAYSARNEAGAVGFFGLAYNRATNKLYYGGCGNGLQSTHGYAVEQNLGDPRVAANAANFTDQSTCTVFDPSTLGLTNPPVSYYFVIDTATNALYGIPTAGTTAGAANPSGTLLTWNGTPGGFGAIGNWDGQDMTALSFDSGANAGALGFQFGDLITNAAGSNVAIGMVPYYNGVSGQGFSALAVAYDVTKGVAGIHTSANYNGAGMATIFSDTTLVGFTGGDCIPGYWTISQFKQRVSPTVFGTRLCRWDASSGFAGFPGGGNWALLDTSQISGASYVGAYQDVCNDGTYQYAIGEALPGIVRIIPGTFTAGSSQAFNASAVPGQTVGDTGFGGAVVCQGHVYCSGYGIDTPPSAGSHCTWLRFPCQGIGLAS